jgi:protein-S-isoprenylcysteine O-methyltransferase Ste14
MNNSIPLIPPPLYFLVAIIIMILLNLFLPITHWLQSPWRYIGILPIVSGFALSLGHGLLFRRLGTNPRPGTKATVLVTKGGYRYTRNPMYLGLVVMLIGIAILLGSLSPVIVVPIFIWIIQTKFVLREEVWMENWFGESYLEYKKKVRRWF